MNDEYCLMEEKSLLTCAHVAERNYLGAHDGLSNFSKAKVPAYSWLPDELRKKIAQSCKNIRTRQGYPVVDWLKQIRNDCDYCECGILSQNVEDRGYFWEKDNYSTTNSIDKLDSIDSCTGTYNINSIMEEVVPEKCLTLRENTNDKFVDLVEIITINDDENNKEEIKHFHIDNALYSDNKNIDIFGHVIAPICEQSQELSDSPTFLLTDVAMYPRRVMCCVNLIRDDCGYFTVCQTQTIRDILDLNLIMNNDDNNALKVCEKFLIQSKIASDIEINRDNLKTVNVAEKNIMESVSTNSQLNNIFYDHTVDCHSFKSPTALMNEDKEIIIDCENDLSIIHGKEKSNVTFPSCSTAAAQWTYNNFDMTQENNKLITSNELLYGSCENFDNNIYMENSCGSKVGDSDYKSICSESSNFPDSLQDIDEETTSFDKYISPIYENIRINSECSSQSLDDTRTSEFYSPSDFNDTTFDDIAILEIVIDECDEINEFRNRKGSVASDIIKWKENLLYEAIDDECDINQVYKRIKLIHEDKCPNVKIHSK